MSKVDYICLDSNAFIDLVDKHREQAHRLLAALSKTPQETRRVVLHMEQVKEIIHTLVNKIIPKLVDRTESDGTNLFREAHALVEYFRNVEHLARTSPDDLEELGLLVGDPGGDLEEKFGARAEVNRYAIEAKNTLGPTIQKLHHSFALESTDAIIVALAKRLKAPLLTSDKKDVVAMCEMIKDREDSGFPPWRLHGDRGWPKSQPYRSAPLPPAEKKLTARQRVESLGRDMT